MSPIPRSKVAVLKTSPKTVVADFARLMDLADMRQELDPAKTTLLKINISWHVYYPACSTSPWQLDGVIRGLLGAGFDAKRILAAQNSTVVVDPHVVPKTDTLPPFRRDTLLKRDTTKKPDSLTNLRRRPPVDSTSLPIHLEPIAVPPAKR